MTEKGDTGVAQRVTPVTGKGDTHDAALKEEPSGTTKEPSGTVSGGRAKRAPVPTERRRPTRIPDDFTVSAAMWDWAEELGMTADQIRFSTDTFLDHWRASTATKLDWVATWRNWIRGDIKRGTLAPRRDGGHLPAGTAGQAEEAWTEVLELADTLPKPFRGADGELTERTRPRFSSPRIERAVASLGWETIWEADPTGRRFLRSQFIKTYNALSTHPGRDGPRGSASLPA
jgi:hypothetical protein